MLRVGIIGTGFGMYGLLPAFGSLKGCKVVSISGKSSERLEKFCKKYKVEKVYSDWQEMLKREQLDALAIAVIPEIQYKIAKIALKKRLHIFAEKPLAANLRQAANLYSLAKKAKVTTAVDFIFPQVPEFKKVKELLKKREIGRLKNIKIEWDFLSHDIAGGLKSWKTDSKKGGGALAYYFSHVLYYLEDLFGRISKFQAKLIYSKKSLSGGEVGVDLLFKTKETLGSAHVNCAAEGVKTHKLFLQGDKGSLILENNKNVTKNFNLTVYKNYKGYKPKVKKMPAGREDERVIVLKENVKNFVWGCKNNMQITPSFKEGLRVQQLISQIRKISI